MGFEGVEERIEKGVVLCLRGLRKPELIVRFIKQCFL